MRVPDIRYLFAYDRWATRRVLAAAAGVEGDPWAGGSDAGERGLAAILVHQLGAHQRWRHGLTGSHVVPRPEREPLPSPDGLAEAWDAEWTATDAWLDAIDEAWLDDRDEGVAHWQMLAHVVNHGTQHRSEAASLLTELGRSPGDLDLIVYAEESARER